MSETDIVIRGKGEFYRADGHCPFALWWNKDLDPSGLIDSGHGDDHFHIGISLDYAEFVAVMDDEAWVGSKAYGVEYVKGAQDLVIRASFDRLVTDIIDESGPVEWVSWASKFREAARSLDAQITAGQS